jgi:hypothetical protein
MAVTFEVVYPCQGKDNYMSRYQPTIKTFLQETTLDQPVSYILLMPFLQTFFSLRVFIMAIYTFLLWQASNMLQRAPLHAHLHVVLGMTGEPSLLCFHTL